MKPIHLRLPLIGLVILGGTFGTATRYLATTRGPDPLHGPLATLTVNLIGALALGVLLEALARRGPDIDGRLAIRVLLGTGFLGGFTTYSALAVDTDELVRAGQLGLAVLYAVGTVLLGALATVLGILLAARHQRRPAR